MVYCGLASKGCSNCRTRRIKCDQRENGCSQCARVKKQCPGYRDQLSLRFRDENERIMKKATKAGHSPRSTEETKNVKEVPTKSPFPSVEIMLASPWESCAVFCQTDSPLPYQGIGFFFTHYSTLMADTRNPRAARNRRSLWHDVATNTLAFDAISCVGLAGLSNVRGDENIMLAARQKYAGILKHIRDSLQQPMETEEELGRIFKAIITLSAFEMVNATSHNTGTWRIHLEGATALLRKLSEDSVRGFLLKPGPRIVIQFLFQTCICYIQPREPFPEGHEQLFRNILTIQAERDRPGALLLTITKRLVDLLASSNTRVEIDPLMTVYEALVLDAELDAWCLNLPPDWTFSVHSMDSEETDSAFHFSSHYHVYRDPWTARTYNNYRWMRIMVNELILRSFAQVDSDSITVEHTMVQQNCLNIISQLATDVCVSLLGQCLPAIEDLEKYNIPTGVQMNGIFVTIWPLMVTASAIGVSENVSEYCIRVLEHMAQHDGVQRALSGVRLAKQNIKSWKERQLHIVRTPVTFENYL